MSNYDQTLAASVAAAGNITSSAVTNSGNKKSQQRANKMQVDFWKMQNEYNHPSAQMERLRKAGLNPNLIYGGSPGSATGNADKIHAAQAAKYDFPNPLQNINMFADLRQREAQTDNLRSQNTVLQQEALLKGIQGQKFAADTAKTKVDTQLAKEGLRYSLDALRENARQMEINTLHKELDYTIKNKTKKEAIIEAQYRAYNAKEHLKGQKLQNELRSLDIDLRRLGVNPQDPIYWRILGRNWGENWEKLKDKLTPTKWRYREGKDIFGNPKN